MITFYRGKKYNTERARLIGAYTYHFSVKTTGHLSQSMWRAALYVSPQGKHYFLHGEGGEMTIFQGRERIIPLTGEQAEAWAKKFLGLDLKKIA